MPQTPHKWLISFDEKALDDLRQLPSASRAVVFKTLRKLLQAENPFALAGTAKLKGRHNIWRTRAGHYRILFELRAEPVEHLKFEYKGTLKVNAIKHRKDVYRQ